MCVDVCVGRVKASVCKSVCVQMRLCVRVSVYERWLCVKASVCKGDLCVKAPLRKLTCV